MPASILYYEIESYFNYTMLSFFTVGEKPRLGIREPGSDDSTTH